MNNKKTYSFRASSQVQQEILNLSKKWGESITNTIIRAITLCASDKIEPKKTFKKVRF